MARYICTEGDMVDAICCAFYGDEPGYTEAVYAANRELAEIGPVLPAGTVVVLPDLPDVEAEAPIVRLWD